MDKAKFAFIEKILHPQLGAKTVVVSENLPPIN
jgi:hypothetical protein